MSVNIVDKSTGNLTKIAGNPVEQAIGISYDHTISGLSASNVQSGIDELASEKQDKSDNTLTTTDKTIVGAVNELKSGLTNVDVALSVPENTGKNVLPLNLDYLKSINAVGTWSGNVYSRNGLDFTVQTDSENNVTGIAVSGTATANAFFELYVNNAGISQFVGCVLNGVQSGDGVGGTYGLGFTGVGAVQYDGNDYTIPSDYSSKTEIYIRVSNGVQLDTVIYPMIRPATITDPTFAPYIPSVETRLERLESNTKLFETASTGTYRDKMNSMYSTVSGLNQHDLINSFIDFNGTICRYYDLTSNIYLYVGYYYTSSTLKARVVMVDASISGVRIVALSENGITNTDEKDVENSAKFSLYTN